MSVEELRLKAKNKTDVSDEMKILKLDCSGNFNIQNLQSELNIFPTISKQSAPVNFRDICSTLQKLDKKPRSLIKNVSNISQIILTSGAKSATPDCSFLLQIRVKIWLPSTMGRKRYYVLSVFNEHKDIVDKISLIEVAKRFIAAQDKYRNGFGTINEKKSLLTFALFLTF